MKNEVTKGGIGFCGVLTLIFITLKVLDLIAWSWLWVLAPLWIPVGLAAIVFMVVIIAFILTGFMK